MRVLICWILLTGWVWALPAFPLGPTKVEVGADFFAGNDTVCYIEDLENGMVYAVHPERVETRHPPFSTFKIPNTLIALETGVAQDLQTPLPYNPETRPEQTFWPPDWAQDQTLKTAFQRSTAWAYQDLALKVGEENYRGFLNHFHYGNQKCQGDAFWLDRSLTISPKEQVDFLRRLLTSQLEIAPLHVDMLKEAAQLRADNGFTLFAKTGAGPTKSNDFEGEFDGWFVGWLERPGAEPVLFALWTRGSSYSAVKDYRRKATEQLLTQLGYLPLDW